MLKELAPHFQFFIASEIPESYFRRFTPELTFRKVSLDTGCAQADFIAVDRPRSFLNLAQFLEHEESLCEKEIQWLEENEIDLLISDVPSVPIKAASEIGIPSMVIANFNWHDIYSGFPEASRYPELISTLRDHYSTCNMQVLPQLHLENNVIPRLETIGLLSLPGCDIRNELQELLPENARNRPWVFIYLGQYDCSEIQWQKLEQMSDYFFLTRDEVPEDIACPNLEVLDEHFAFPDLMASSDLVLTKAGYSTLATAFSHNKPVVTCERPGFKEFEAVQSFLTDNNIGQILASEPFYNLEWQDSIKKALKLTVKDKIETHGERDIKTLIDNLLNTSSG
ncbi:MAG: hypothetical protein G3M70_12500 [Candidatus Nitronauta litoralis]|uniref:Glycosyl transferase family 28 C-terminal domain-containing protein n=1 Tax=Candidatus Nitronauta litoralis TaxID=2705533 RepID=A0A7T0BXC6_9BACT|nr:MAG: hypothetical protein G3M70_12500 [Candidatus Nitronauta litoralis]